MAINLLNGEQIIGYVVISWRGNLGARSVVSSEALLAIRMDMTLKFLIIALRVFSVTCVD